MSSRELHRENGQRVESGVQSSLCLVSIIVVVFQDVEELKAILSSILPYRSDALEVIVIDGGSNDGTVDLLKGMSDSIDYWKSEPDTGIYDAMNKGLRAAKGVFVLHLNAGDRLLHVPLDALSRCMDEGVEIVTCRVLIDGRTIFLPRVGLSMRLDNWWHHQGTFYRRSAHLAYDTSYRICGDFEHNQRLMLARSSVSVLSTVVSEHRNDGISMNRSARAEIYRSIATHFGSVYIPIAFLRFSINDARKFFLRTYRFLMRQDG